MADIDADSMLSIALTKGRILKDTLPLLASVGIEPAEDAETTRKLRVDTSQSNTRLLLVRASDVPAYVEYGGADIGVTGKDVLLEHSGRGIYEPLDLGIGKCQLVLAGKRVVDAERAGLLRIATKYPEVTRQFFDRRGQQVEIIKLLSLIHISEPRDATLSRMPSSA